jgi:CheY-like chemotaxis protein
VNIYSEPDEGTTVKIYLPRLVSEASEEVKSGDGIERSPEAETILVVEDDDDVRAYTVECLTELGYNVLQAHDAEAALRLIERHGEPLDLLFTDVVMPGLSGRELADAARALQPGLKVLYTSGYTRNAIVHGGRLDPGVEMIVKPFTFEALGKKVRDMLDIGRTGRVLIVEPDATVRLLAIDALAGGGYAAEEAATAGEALGKVRAAQGRYDFLLIDRDLPDLTGDAVAGEVRAMHVDLPILITVGHSPEEVRRRFAEDRCTAVLQKPYSAALLQEALRATGADCAQA